MHTDDRWAQVWAEMTDDELLDRLREYLWLAANTPDAHAGRIGQLQHEATRRGRPELVDAARNWVTTHLFTPNASS